MRSRLAIAFAVLMLGGAALALVALDLGLAGMAAGRLTGIGTGTGTGMMVLLISPAGPAGAFQLAVAGLGPRPTVFGIATADLPLLALAAWLVIVPVGLLVAWRMAGRMSRPLAEVTEVARRAGPGNLAQRLPVTGLPDEIGELSEAFNELMSRFEQHEIDRRRLIDDAAHEVRNPLAVMRTSLEVALADRDDPSALWTAAEVSQRAGERIARTIDGLRAELRDRAPETARSPVDLARIAHEMGRDYSAVAMRRGVAIQVLAPNAAWVPADREALKRALANLVVNAIRFAPPGSPILVGAGDVPGWRWLGVRDFGPGIDGADQPLVFRRGWRGPAQDGVAGSGIGLALVRQIAEAHGGSVRLSSAPRAGCSFVIWLPAREGDGRQAPAPGAQPDAMSGPFSDPLWWAAPVLA